VNQPPQDPNRNLKIRADGPIQARFCVPLPDPYGSERITIPLSTRDIDEARARRDCVEQALHIAASKIRPYT